MRAIGRYAVELDAAKRRIIRVALAAAKGNVTHACRDLGLTRAGLYRLCRSLAIDPGYYRGGWDEPSSTGGGGGDPLQRYPHPSPGPGGANARPGGTTEQPGRPSRPGR